MLRLLFLLLFAHAALALEIKETRWGFDGKVVAGGFNLFSVLIAEPGPKPFEGEIVLTEDHTGVKNGAPYVQPVYVSPGTSRWVQFLPVMGTGESWRLSWGRGEKQAMVLDPPAADAPATVLLYDATSTFTAGANLKRFPEELFPASVAATDGLDQVVLDHVPRWDAPRREAFLDWVRRGGLVHVLRGPAGFPVFQGDLAVLNVDDSSTKRFGAGSVTRHDVARDECNEQYLANAGFPLRTPKKNDGSNPVLYRFDQTLLQNLAGLTKPNVQWWLLYLLTIGYLVVIGPVHYIWSRKVDYRLAIAGFLGSVAVFALAFIVAGQRGAGENQTSHALAIARSLSGNRWDVQEWVSAFATKGDLYRITHAAPANFYGLPSGNEGVNGRCVGGKDGHLDADIPLFSARPFMHRAVLTGPAPDVKLIEWKPSRIAIDAPTAPFDRALWVCAYAHGRYWTLRHEGRWFVGDSGGEDAATFFSQDKINRLQQLEWAHLPLDVNSAYLPLVARFTGDLNGLPNAITRRPLPTDQLQLMLYAETPPSFAAKAQGFDQGHGRALYIIDLFRPAKPTP